MLRVLTLSTLFPDASRPNFGIFVERQSKALIEHQDVAMRIVAPIGIPPWPLSQLPRFAALSQLPEHEDWHGLPVDRPRFLSIPGIGGRGHAALMARALIPRLTEIRHDFPFDLISAEFFFPDGPAAIALGRHFGVPVSITARGSDIHYWGHRAGSARQILAAGRAADGMVAVSAALARDMAALGMPSERIAVVHTGVDLERFAPRDRNAAKTALGVGGPLIVSLGALIPLKGHDIVVAALERLPAATLLILGEGPDRARLEAMIAERGLGQRVRLMGAVPHDDVPGILAAADAMALASEREGLANAWVEALASGTPIVVPDVGGAREVVTSPAAGRIAERTPEGFAAALNAILAQPPSQAQVRACAEGFTWDKASAALAAHFTRLTQR